MTAYARTAEPPADCTRCSRLTMFRRENRQRFPDFHNGPVPSWGTPDAPLLIVGLAPGLKGANRTGRPFTGDASGDVLFDALVRAGLATLDGDEIHLHGCAITNAVACVPPQNRPNAAEVANCRSFLTARMKAGVRVALALGHIAHDAVIRSLGARPSSHRFGHGAETRIGALRIVSSYHPSRYNVATKR